MAKIIGGILILLGIADFGLYLIDIDLYREIGINVPDRIQRWTSFLVIGIGYGIFSIGKPSKQEEEA